MNMEHVVVPESREMLNKEINHKTKTHSNGYTPAKGTQESKLKEPPVAKSGATGTRKEMLHWILSHNKINVLESMLI